LQRTHSWRGSGASTGSLSAMGCNQIKLMQIEQRKGLYQCPLCPVSRLVATVPSFPGVIISLAVLFGRTTRFQQEGEIIFARVTLRRPVYVL
jgi:hypothetical protein